MIDRPVFLGGHRKGGTTMFLRLFDGHQSLAVYPTDLSLLYGFYPAYFDGNNYSFSEQMERFEIVAFEPLRADLERLGAMGSFDFEKFKEEVVSKLTAEDLKDEGRMLKFFLEIASAYLGNDRKLLVVKETSCDIMFARLKQVFPRAKMIHLLRDPRDNAASIFSGLRSHYAQFGEDDRVALASIIHRCGLDFRMAQANLQTFGADSYKVIRFEDLVYDVEKEMDGIAEWLDIPTDDILYRPTSFGLGDEGNNFEGKKFGGVDAGNINRWEERLPHEVAKILEFHFAESMSRWDYNRAFSDKDCLLEVNEFYQWANQEFFFKDSFLRYQN